MDHPGPDDGRHGLSKDDAASRLAHEGPNALPDMARHGWLAIVSEAAREPMLQLVLGAAILYLLLGDPRESGFLLAMVAAMLGMTLYQEGRTERSLQALRDLSAPMATVRRDGLVMRIAARELVRGDLIVLTAGDRVPADTLLLEASGMMVDESLLTGESVPVGKRAAAADEGPATPGGENTPWVFGGTLVVQGDGLGVVRATGPRSELGRIGASLGQLAPPASRLQRDTRALARRLAALGLIVSLLLVAMLGLRHGDWLQALLAGVALSMSMLPEEFPVILTVFPALGAWRLAQQQVLTRRLAAIEVLGSTSVLCVDKTGTLTENRMVLRTLWRAGTSCDLASGPLPPSHVQLLAQAVLASRPATSDPIELALHRAAQASRAASALAPGLAHLEREYALTDVRPAMVHIRRGPDGTRAYAKGAPETIVALCQEADPSAILLAAAQLAAQGLRVLGVAASAQLSPPWPEDPGQLRYRFTGLVALADPLRADIPQAVAQCRGAGIRIVMITGDHPQTARAIAREAGLAEGAILTGQEIASLSPDALAARLAGVVVCARIAPGQKLAIVRALQRNGAVVAMTGDGVNDAPALRAADVGVAMGTRGTDVAREASQLTLLDNRFASLVLALRAGRRIYSNMRKSMRYVSAIHAPIAVLALVPPLAGWPILLYPMHIVFLELMIDPACSLAFENEPEESDLMRKPPRPHDEPLLGRGPLLSALACGLWAATLLAGWYWLALSILPELQARAAAFSALILSNLALMLVYRQPGSIFVGLSVVNPLLVAIVAVAVAMLACSVYLPAMAELFRLAPPPLAWMGLALLVPLALLSGVQTARWIRRSAARGGTASDSA